MAMFPTTLGDPYPPNHPNFFAFFVAFHIFVVSKHRDFIFGVQVDGVPADGQQTVPERGVVTSRDTF